LGETARPSGNCRPHYLNALHRHDHTAYYSIFEWSFDLYPGW